MADRLVTIASFTQAYQAHLARIRLEEERVPCCIADEHIVSTNWFYSNAVNGVKLQVRESDAARAIGILRESGYAGERTQERGAAQAEAEEQTQVAEAAAEGAAAVPEEAPAEEARAVPEEVRCPACGSTEVYYERFSRGAAFLSVLLFWFPVPVPKRQWGCYQCGRRWKAAPGEYRTPSRS